jgi:3-oxoacyl-[acyl-carrier protein] reductase
MWRDPAEWGREKDAALVEVALVTGAAHGIGRAIAERLALDGFRVLAADVDPDQLTINQDDWTGRGLSISGHVLDCRDRAGIVALLDGQDRIDVEVNNAGIGGDLKFVGDLSRAEIAMVMEINLLGAFRVAQEAARRMRPGGRIINIASRGYLGGAGAAHYVASKAAMVALTRAMAIELRWSGLRVNAVAPGMVDTRALSLFGDMRSKLEALEPTGNAHDPGEIADIVAFLAGPASRFINGDVLLADGGKSIGCPPL